LLCLLLLIHPLQQQLASCCVGAACIWVHHG
jgi:hypothetical protein